MHKFQPDRAFVINLARRPDRLQRFRNVLPSGFPWSVEVWPAVDGRAVPHPQWWNAGGGAWGCYRSHLQILEAALQQGWQSYVVFEDDADFAPDFIERTARFLEAVPEDAELIYLGGQLLYANKHPPQRINELVYQPYNVNRTHAMIIRTRAGMARLYRHLTRHSWHRANHIDHHLGRLVQKKGVACYCPPTWLVGQCEGRSNISGKRFNESRYYESAEVEEDDTPFFAVMGPHRSGTSMVATLLVKLGVHMGNQLGGYEGEGGGEAKGLAVICEQAMKFPRVIPKDDFDTLCGKLSRWVVQRQAEAKATRRVAGGKYPHLCAFGSHLLDCLSDSLRVIAVDRPLEDSIRSLYDRGQKAGGWLKVTEDQARGVQTALKTQRDKFLTKHPDVPRLHIDYYQALENPVQAVEQICEFLARDGYVPTAAQRQAAIDHIDPAKNRHGSQCVTM